MFEILFQQKEFPSIGARGEKAAAKYLKKNGYRILDRNFSNTGGRRLGEIDIIARDGEEIVFIEVKTRTTRGPSLLLPEENITYSKLYKLNKIASFYLSRKNLTGSTYRFDAITLVADPRKNCASLRHLKNIFL